MSSILYFLRKFFKPNFFAKGFEYSASGLPKATEEELRVVKSYGNSSKVIKRG